MRKILVMKVDVRRHEVVEVAFPEHDEMIEVFDLNRLNESLDERLKMRRLDYQTITNSNGQLIDLTVGASGSIVSELI